MATPERDTVYSTETNRTAYTRESSSTGWFVGIIVALALLAIGYLVFSANNNGGGAGAGTTNVDVNNSPALTAPADTGVTAPADTNTTPLAAPADDAAATAPAAGDDAAAPAAGGEAAAPAAGADAAAPATTP